MSKMGEEFEKNLDKAKYDMYEALKKFEEVYSAFNSVQSLRVKDEDAVSMLNDEMDRMRNIVAQVLAKAEGSAG